MYIIIPAATSNFTVEPKSHALFAFNHLALFHLLQACRDCFYPIKTLKSLLRWRVGFAMSGRVFSVTPWFAAARMTADPELFSNPSYIETIGNHPSFDSYSRCTR
jgi:hypothetical protein